MTRVSIDDRGVVDAEVRAGDVRRVAPAPEKVGELAQHLLPRNVTVVRDRDQNEAGLADRCRIALRLGDAVVDVAEHRARRRQRQRG
jgi:hypothetical protein